VIDACANAFSISFGHATCGNAGRLRDYRAAASITGSDTMRTVLLVILILLLLGALPTWPYSTGWGYYPSGGLAVILILLIVFGLMGRR
jgi:Protein of unknown function (DUF3309)